MSCLPARKIQLQNSPDRTMTMPAKQKVARAGDGGNLSLDRELDRLRLVLGLTDELGVVWLPDATRGLEGEVKGTTVYVYSTDPGAALRTMEHEVVDYAITKAIAPYRDVTNALIEVVNEHAYQEKERLVERLCKLLH
jgi:hypothetical protein